MTRRPARWWATIASAACVLTVSACGDSSGSDPAAGSATTDTASATKEPPAPHPSTRSPHSSTPAPTAPTGPTAPTPAPVDDSVPARAEQAQIPPARLPGFDDTWRWDVKTAGAGPGQGGASVCMKASLTAIGAVAEYRTDFGSDLDDVSSAVQVSAVFPDQRTAVRSSLVLAGWQRDCEAHATDELGLQDVAASEVTTVPTPVGPGQQRLVTYRSAPPVPGDPDATWLGAEGFVRDGDTLTYLVIRTAARDDDYPTGEEPMGRALAVAGQLLAETR